ncbi:Predicted Zn-dependent peptidase [Clostridium amylolyticum]|uniref:Predicted Zn-dependent peptidase n=1 Tax=Clostridium amylolyticum TaxID=1121298 RepID=A0A1M6KRH4_9CLOT|nr:pitrilysin family protein [Clostridium amylolyticum]SHJ61531.1 Predicted Zn-dependent peptidase [Clostridium amylolyticum]
MNKLMFNSCNHSMNNGLKVVTIKKETKLASIHVGLKVGAMFEDKHEKGVSHLIEHMLFKGTKSRNNERLNEELEFLGGDYNAYTDYTCTVYGVTALEEELEKSVELLSDMLINSTFTKEELEKEKNVIVAEIRANNDDIEDYSFKKAHEAAFNVSALKNDVAGTEESVLSISREMLLNFYNKYYCPNNCVITVVSSLDHEEVIDILSKYLSKWEEKHIDEKKFIKEKNNSLLKTSYKNDMEQSTITYLFTFNELPKSMELPLKILNLKLGESSNSILFRELRENRGLAYDIYTFLDMSKNVKTLYIYTAVSEENIEETMNAINKCIDGIKNKKILFNTTTVNLMKKVHKTAVVSTLEDSTDLGNYVLHQCLEDENIYEFIQDMHRLENLQGSHIYDVANVVLNDPTIHILKPI